MTRPGCAKKWFLSDLREAKGGRTAAEPGNIVELTTVASGREVLRLRARNLAEGGCYYGNVPVGTAVEALGAASLMGPRGSASLYCAGIEREGWQRPRTYWHKLPGATAESTGSGSTDSR